MQNITWLQCSARSITTYSYSVKVSRTTLLNYMIHQHNKRTCSMQMKLF